MPLPKIWSAYERLTADDLNADFAYLIGRGEPIPGASAHSSGIVALTAAGNCKLDVLDAGRAAIMDGAANRFLIPAGLGGLWRVSAVYTVQNTAAGERHIGSILRNGALAGAQYAYPNVGGTIVVGLALDLILAAGDAITFTGTSTVSADWTVQALIALASTGGLA